MANCQLCFRPPTKRNPLNRHHIRGRKRGQHLPIMRVHSVTCHQFCQWITNIYLLHGWEDELTEALLVEAYQRTINLQRDGKFVIRYYE